MVDDCLYSLNQGLVNYSMTNSTASFYNATNTTMLNQSHKVNFYCNDTSRNINGSEFAEFVVLYTPPNITINLPTGTLSSKTITINITIQNSTDAYCEFNISRGASSEVANTEIVNCKNTTALVSSDADYIIWVMVNNTFNYRNISNQSFSVDTTTDGVIGGGGGGGTTDEVEEEVIVITCEIYRTPLNEAWKKLGEDFNFENVKGLWNSFWDRGLCDGAGSIVPIS